MVKPPSDLEKDEMYAFNAKPTALSLSLKTTRSSATWLRNQAGSMQWL